MTSGSSPGKVIPTVRIATRGSALALVQARQVQAACREQHPDQQFSLEVLRTTGDKWQGESLSAGHLPKGLFTKEIESALLEHQADLAVHSLKDLPTALPAGLHLGAVGARIDVRDVLVVRDPDARGWVDCSGRLLQDRRWLPEGAIVATNSTRRAAQLKSARSDVRIVPIRGNVGTRLKKLAAHSEWRATLLAAAGLERLDYRIGEEGFLEGPEVPAGLRAMPIPVAEMLPCVGQAALGIETRANDPLAARICQGLDHAETRHCVVAERSFLAAMGGGCQLAVAAHARAVKGGIQMEVMSYLGGDPVGARGEAGWDEAEALGQELAREVTAGGGGAKA